MKRQKACPTRRRTALRRWGAALLLAAVLAGTGMYRVLPGQAVAAAADRGDVDHPRVVKWVSDRARSGLYSLVEGDDALMLCLLRFSPTGGWYDSGSAVVETWQNAAVSAGICSHNHRQDGRVVIFLFGRVEADIRRLELEATFWEEEAEAMTVRTVPVPAEDLFEEHGRRYFVTELEDLSLDNWIEGRVLGWTDSGQIRTSEPLLRWYWST